MYEHEDCEDLENASLISYMSKSVKLKIKKCVFPELSNVETE